MADVAVTAAQVAPTDPCHSTIRPFIAAAAITKGQSLYVNTSGKVDLCDANAAGCEQFVGIALSKAAAGQVVDVLMKGPVAGFDLSGIAYGAAAFQSDTAGSLATALSATKTIRVGRVLPMSDNPTLTKVLFVEVDMNQVW